MGEIALEEEEIIGITIKVDMLEKGVMGRMRIDAEIIRIKTEVMVKIDMLRREVIEKIGNGVDIPITNKVDMKGILTEEILTKIDSLRNEKIGKEDITIKIENMAHWINLE